MGRDSIALRLRKPVFLRVYVEQDKEDISISCVERRLEGGREGRQVVNHLDGVSTYINVCNDCLFRLCNEGCTCIHSFGHGRSSGT